MFTGIVSQAGTLIKIEESQGGRLLQIESKSLAPDLKIGDSVNVSGVCLTVIKISKDSFFVQVIPETLKRSSFSRIKAGELLNLEASLTLSTPLGGHLVVGHVDCTGVLEEIIQEDENKVLKISYPEEFSNLVAQKGCIAVEGISLTVVEAQSDYFTVAIIPHTWQVTNLQSRRIGEGLNLEFDLIVRYVARQMQTRPESSKITEKFLEDLGYSASRQRRASTLSGGGSRFNRDKQRGEIYEGVQ